MIDLTLNGRWQLTVPDHRPQQWVIGDPAASSERSHLRLWDRVGWLLADAGFAQRRQVWDRDVTGYADEWLWVTSTR